MSSLSDAPIEIFDSDVETVGDGNPMRLPVNDTIASSSKSIVPSKTINNHDDSGIEVADMKCETKVDSEMEMAVDLPLVECGPNKENVCCNSVESGPIDRSNPTANDHTLSITPHSRPGTAKKRQTRQRKRKRRAKPRQKQQQQQQQAKRLRSSDALILQPSSLASPKPSRAPLENRFNFTFGVNAWKQWAMTKKCRTAKELRTTEIIQIRTASIDRR